MSGKAASNLLARGSLGMAITKLPCGLNFAANRPVGHA
jgi:hypothetical protein